MDYIFLPEKIRKDLEARLPGLSALSVLRAGGAPGGLPGESYIVVYLPELFLFYRNLGEEEYHIVEHNLASDGLPEFSSRLESYNLFLDAVLKGRAYSLKFSSFDKQAVFDMLEKTKLAKSPLPEAQQKPSVPAAAPARKPSIRPMVGLAALLMFESVADGSIDASEDDYIKRLFEGRQELLQEGLAFFKNRSAEELFAELSYLDRQQALCCLAHLFEFGMLDGALRSSEQKFIRRFAEALKIDEEELSAVRDVLLVKNQISVMF